MESNLGKLQVEQLPQRLYTQRHVHVLQSPAALIGLPPYLKLSAQQDAESVQSANLQLPETNLLECCV